MACMPTKTLIQPAPESAVEDRLASEWLSLYLTHYRRTLSSPELVELADVLQRGSTSASGLTTLATQRTASEGRWLIEFLANVKSAPLRGKLVQETIIRLRAAARSR